MDPTTSHTVFHQLDERRAALRRAIDQVGPARDLLRLLSDVDQAMGRLGTAEFGKCLICDGQMDDAEMVESPTRRYCLCDLSTAQRAALQLDLDTAWQVQGSLLPSQNLAHAGWQTHFRYLPAGPVSGDYCDLLTQPSSTGWLYFLVGDVSGKGIAAAYWMAHLSALIRRTLDEPVSVAGLMETVNRHLSDRPSDSHFVTLAAGRAHRSGRVEIANAGHCRPIVLRRDESFALKSSGLPLGIWDKTDPETCVLQLDVGDSLVLFTDGISEATNPQGNQFGAAALEQSAFAHRQLAPAQLAAACLEDLRRFQAGLALQDDLTLLILRRETP